MGLFLGIYFITLYSTGRDFSCFPGDLGDARFNNYILEHAHRYFTGKEKSYWDAPFMYPEENIIAYSDNLLGTAPFYSFLRIIGNDRETAFQYWFILIIVLNYLASYLFLVRYFRNNYAAVLGAMVFTFSMALQSQMAHAQTFPRFAIPLAFWMALLFAEKLKPLYFFLAILFIVYEIYCGIYLGFMLMIPIGILFLFTLKIKRNELKEHWQFKKWKWQMVISLLVNIVILAPLMIPYAMHASDAGLLNYKEHIRSNIPTIKSHFFSRNGTLLWDWLSEMATDYPAWWDHRIFAGGLATVALIIFLVIIGIKLYKKEIWNNIQLTPSVKIIFYTIIFNFLFFLRFGNFSLYRIIYFIPGFGSMKALQRIINIELLFFAIALTFLLTFLLKKDTIKSFLLFILLLGIFMVDNYFKPASFNHTSKAYSQERVSTLMDKMKDIPEGSVIAYEPLERTDPLYAYKLDAMLASQSLNLKSVTGYTGSSPRGYSNYWRNMDKESRKPWFDYKGFKPDTVYVIY